MSSPTRLSKSPVGIREGTRVILREITATLQNSPPAMSPGKKVINLLINFSKNLNFSSQQFFINILKSKKDCIILVDIFFIDLTFLFKKVHIKLLVSLLVLQICTNNYIQ